MAAAPQGAAVQGVLQFSGPIASFAWSPDGARVAVCLNSSEIEVWDAPLSQPAPATPNASITYHNQNQQWQRSATLRAHHQLVSALDWNSSGALVSCSHDRNAFVWKRDEATGEWEHGLVVTRLTRGALCVKWSPCQSKFAIGSASRGVCVCYHDAQMKWWACKLMTKKHDSAVVCVSWHPSSQLIATACMDGQVRVLTAHIPGVDPAAPAGSSGSNWCSFGQTLATIDPCDGWVHSVAWTPSGDELLCATHGGGIFATRSSEMHLDGSAGGARGGAAGGSSGGGDAAGVTSSSSSLAEAASSEHAAAAAAAAIQPSQRIDPSPSSSAAAAAGASPPQLPLKCLLALTDEVVVGAGWDGLVRVFSRESGGAEPSPDGAPAWWLHRLLGVPPQAASAAARTPQRGNVTPQLAAKMQRLGLHQQQADGIEPGTDVQGRSRDQGAGLEAAHRSCVTGLAPAAGAGAGGSRGFVSAGLDGRMIMWGVDGLGKP